MSASFDDDSNLTQLGLWTSEDIEREASFDLSYASVDCSKVDTVTAQLDINHYFRNNGTNEGTVELYVYKTDNDK